MRKHRDRPAVLGPGAFVGAERLGPFLAVADHRHPTGGDSARLEIVLRRIGAPVAQSEIIIPGAALVGMALDRDPDGRVALEPLGLGVEGRAIAIVRLC